MAGWLFLIVLLAFAFTATSTFAADVPMLVSQGETMGSTYSVKIFDPPQTLSEDWRFQIDKELRSITDQMSTYLATSEISRFNDSNSLDWFEVSPGFAAVVSKALEISTMSEGAFDITVLPLVKAWSFGPSKKRNVPPSDDELATLRKVVGSRFLEVRQDPPALRKQIADLTIDLNAITPGYAADRLVMLLQDMGAKNLFVEVGGEVRCTGDKAGEPWMVGIQQPDVDGLAVAIAYPLRDRSIATSGDYRSFFEYEGKRYSHTIDPRTARPVTHQLASVTVLADDCMTADALATTLSVLGDQEGHEWAKRYELDALFMVRGEDGNIRQFGTGAFEQLAAAPGSALTPATPASPSLPDASSLTAFWPIAIACLFAFGMVIAAMAVGVMFGRRAISGSCGGLANKRDADGSVSCSLCSNPDNACKELRNRMQTKS